MLGVVLAALALSAAARGLVRHNTWYLASDQFAFLTFADDLAHGRILHDPSTVELLAPPLFPKDAAADAYYQTYIWRDGRLYSRYPPGFPLLLAATRLAAGETAEHWLNPALYLLLLVVLALLTARLTAGGRAVALAAGVAGMWALLVVPAEVHYWGITVVRDLPAHLLALIALLAALSGRAGWAGLGLGFAASIRPDAVLWGTSLGLALAPRRSRATALARGSAGFVVGALPLFAYNTITEGHPLAFTQGSEFRWLFVASPRAVTASVLGGGFVSGGAFRLANFPSTFPAHVRYLVASFGTLLVAAAGMLAWGTAQRLPIARALGPYAVVALLFYSCWGHGDPRYLVGVSLCLIALAASGLTMFAHRMSRPDLSRGRRLAVILGVVVLTAAAQVFLPRDPAHGLVMLERAVAAAIALATLVPLVLPASRARSLLAATAPALAIAALGLVRAATAQSGPSSFQHAQIERARGALEALVPPRAIVLTTPALGRPAENITYYTHADANYLGEAERLGSDANMVGFRAEQSGRRFFLLLPGADPLPFTWPASWWTAREVARREGDALRDWFVDPKRAASGAVLYEATVRPTLPPH